MIKIYPYENLETADFGWLKARHHFSFGHYRNPQRMGFGKLLVINDDTIKPSYGFAKHPHHDMEIITYVRSGAITHKDNQGNEGRTEAGDIQVMSAGSGIEHSEYNFEDDETNLYQIWIRPNKLGVKPRWDTKEFPKQLVTDSLPLLVSSQDDNAPLSIHQDAQIYGGRLQAGSLIHHPIKNQAYLLLSGGQIELEGELINKGDGVEITDVDSIRIKALTEAEILIIDVPS